MDKFHVWVNTVLIIGVAILVLVGGNQSVDQMLGGGTRFPNGISADTTSPVAGEVRGTDLTITDDATITDDFTVSGGPLTVTTSNSATSTVILGCAQTYATSTATTIRPGFDTTSTTTAKNQYGTTVAGLVTWGYGSCPF